MKQREKPYEEIYDLLAIRVLVNSVPDCYHALGVIHDGWTPRAGAHQGLHRAAEVERLPVAAHDGVRTRRDSCTRSRSARARCTARRTSASPRTGCTRRTRRARTSWIAHLAWFRQVLELQLDAKTPDEFLEFLKLDLYQDEIFVFTPTGDVIQLPKGATPIDFAFAVHTEVGLHCAGAKVNGRIAPCRAQLRNSETVEIITVADARSRAATGWRTSGPVVRATRSGSGCGTRSTRSVGEARPGDPRS